MQAREMAGSVIPGSSRLHRLCSGPYQRKLRQSEARLLLLNPEHEDQSQNSPHHSPRLQQFQLSAPRKKTSSVHWPPRSLYRGQRWQYSLSTVKPLRRWHRHQRLVRIHQHGYPSQAASLEMSETTSQARHQLHRLPDVWKQRADEDSTAEPTTSHRIVCCADQCRMRCNRH